MFRRSTLALLLVALACPGAALGATKWTTWTNTDGGFNITVPSAWFPVPNTVSGVDTLIAKAKAANDAAVAQIYSALIATAAERKALASESFQAFAYSTEPVVTDVTVAVGSATATQTSAAGLANVGKTLVATFQAQGWKVAKPRVAKLRSGDATFVNGTYPVKGATADFAVYVIAHGKHLYELTFHADAAAPNIKSLSTTIAEIADLFAFS